MNNVNKEKTMSKITSSDIKSFAESMWEKGYRGSAYAHVQCTRKLTKAESDMIRETFRPLVMARLEKLAATPKRELNKGYDYGVVNAVITLDGVRYQFYTDSCVRVRYVNGRRIADLMTVDEILNRNLLAYWHPNGSNDWRGTASYEALVIGENGVYTHRSRSVIRQPGVELNSRGGFNRSKSKADFVRLVKNHVKQNMEAGWTLVSTSYEQKYTGRQYRLDFVKPDPVETPDAGPADEGGLGISSVEPLEKDLSRIGAIIDKYGNDKPKAVAAAKLMNSKINDEEKRARRRAACMAYGADWLAECFAA